MFSVFRVSGSDDTDAEGLQSLGARLSSVMPGFYQGMDKVPGRFSGAISESPIWLDQEEALVEFLRRCTEVLSAARSRGYHFEYDLAVGSEDLGDERDMLTLGFDAETVQHLADLGCTLTVTVYCP